MVRDLSSRACCSTPFWQALFAYLSGADASSGGGGGGGDSIMLAIALGIICVIIVILIIVLLICLYRRRVVALPCLGHKSSAMQQKHAYLMALKHSRINAR